MIETDILDSLRWNRSSLRNILGAKDDIKNRPDLEAMIEKAINETNEAYSTLYEILGVIRYN